MKITNNSLDYIEKIGLPWTSFVVSPVKHPTSKKITGTLFEPVPVTAFGRDKTGPFLVVGDEKQPRTYRDGTEIEIFLHDLPDNVFTFRPFSESNRVYDTNPSELDRIKRLLATGLAMRSHRTFVGWTLEGCEAIDGQMELIMVFENEGDALLAGSLFHENLGDVETDFTSIEPTKETAVPWLTDEEHSQANETGKA